MMIVGRDRLDAFCADHPDVRPWIEAWLYETEDVSWATPQDIKDRYATASFLPGNIVIFNVRGNNYRLEIHVAFRHAIVTVIWAGTDRQYDARNRRR